MPDADGPFPPPEGDAGPAATDGPPATEDVSTRTGAADATDAPDHADGGPEPVPIDQRKLTLVLIPIFGFVLLGYVALVVSPKLVTSHPAVLLLLDSRLRNLLLTVAGGISPVAYATFGALRLLAPDPFFYLLGHWFGDAGVRWVEDKAGHEATWYYRWLDRAFRKAGPALVVIMPNNVVCLLAGTARMKPRTFVVLDLIGTAARLTLMWVLAKLFERQLKHVLDWVTRFQWPLIGVMVLTVVIQSTRSVRRQLALERAAAAPEAQDNPVD